MQGFKIVNQNNQISFISEASLENILTQSNLNSGELNFSPSLIIEKTKNYLEIFLLNPQNNLSKNQFMDLVSQVLTENNFHATAEQFQKNFDNYSPKSPIEERNSNKMENLFSKNIQEKFRQLYFHNQNDPISFEQLLKNIASKNCPTTISQKITNLINQKKFLPHQNILREKSAYDEQHFNLADDLNNIFDTLKQLAINFQNNTATTINFSALRAKLSPIKSTKGLSSGPVSFIKIFTSTYEALRQNSQNDHNILQTIVLNIHHPDILEYLIFIKNFQKQGGNRNFLFQIQLSSAFLEALQKEDDFELINPQTHEIVNYLSAKNTFDLIVTTIEENPQLGLINNSQTANPQIKTQNYICLSGILNLGEYYQNHQLQEKSLIEDLQIIQNYLLSQSKKLSITNSPKIFTKINLSGFADLLIGLQISFSSIQSLEFLENFLNTIKLNLKPEIIATINLNSPIINLLESSRGLESYDNLIISKLSLNGQESFQIIPELLKQLQNHNLTSSELYKQISETNSLQNIYLIPSLLKNLFLTNHELSSELQLNLQHLFEQKLEQPIDKKIYFDNNFDQDHLRQLILEFLSKNLKSFQYCTFEKSINIDQSNQTINPDKNFLHNLNKNRRKRSQQIQPPLFQIKKTEEVLLPPIMSPQQK